MQALLAGDLDRFMASEAAQRRPGHWPPYGRLAALIVSAEYGRGGGRAGPRPRPRRAARGRASPCWARRRRRWRSCAGGTGGGCC